MKGHTWLDIDDIRQAVKERREVVLTDGAIIRFVGLDESGRSPWVKIAHTLPSLEKFESVIGVPLASIWLTSPGARSAPPGSYCEF